MQQEESDLSSMWQPLLWFLHPGNVVEIVAEWQIQNFWMAGVRYTSMPTPSPAIHAQSMLFLNTCFDKKQGKNRYCQSNPSYRENLTLACYLCARLQAICCRDQDFRFLQQYLLQGSRVNMGGEAGSLKRAEIGAPVTMLTAGVQDSQGSRV